MKRGKTYLETCKKFERQKLYEPQEALNLVKELAAAKFDETVSAC